MNIQKLTLLLLCGFICMGLDVYPTNPESVKVPLLPNSSQEDVDTYGSTDGSSSDEEKLSITPPDFFDNELKFDSIHDVSSRRVSESDANKITNVSNLKKFPSEPILPKVTINNEPISVIRANSAPLPKASQYPILPSIEIRPDITLFMRKAYEGDWQYFKNLANGNLSLSEKLKNLIYLRNLTATDNNGQTVLHWALKSPKGPEKTLTMHWLTKYLTNELKNDEFTQFFKLKNNKEQTVSDLIFEGYTQKPFKIEDPTTDTLPHLVYGLYLNNIAEPRLFYDVLAWAVGRNKESEVEWLIKWGIEKNENFIFKKNTATLDTKPLFEYTQSPSMQKLVESYNNPKKQKYLKLKTAISNVLELIQS